MKAPDRVAWTSSGYPKSYLAARVTTPTGPELAGTLTVQRLGRVKCFSHALQHAPSLQPSDACPRVRLIWQTP